MKDIIEEYPIPLVFKKIFKEQLTGILDIKSSKIHKVLYFEKGQLIYATSNMFDERLGVILHLTGKLSDQQYDYISGLAHSINQEVGKILLQNNFINKSDLKETVIYQTRRIAVSSFSLDKGEWKFSKTTLSSKKPRSISLPLHNIIYEGGQRTEAVAFINRKYYFHAPLASDIPANVKPGLSGEDMYFFHKLAKCEHMPNEKILAKLNVEPDYYWEKVTLFFLLGMIDFVEKNIDYNIEEDIASLIQLRLKIENQDPDDFEILGVDKSDTFNEIHSSYLTLAQRYNPERFGSAQAPEIKKSAAIVYSRIEKAYSNLSKKGQEDSGVLVLTEEVVDGVLKEKPEVIPVEKVEDGAIIESNLPEIEMDDEFDIHFDYEEAVDKAIEIPSKTKPLQQQEKAKEIKKEKPEAVEPPKEEVIKEIASEKEAEAEKEVVSEGKVEVSKEDGRKTRSEARELYLKAKELSLKKHYDEAISLLKKAVKLEPSIGEYFLLLGNCQSHMMFFFGEAEINLKKAIELEPFNPEPIFSLAELFNREGKKILSEKCYRRVLEIDPRYVKATLALQEIRKRKSVKKKSGRSKKK